MFSHLNSTINMQQMMYPYGGTVTDTLLKHIMLNGISSITLSTIIVLWLNASSGMFTQLLNTINNYIKQYCEKTLMEYARCTIAKLLSIKTYMITKICSIKDNMFGKPTDTSVEKQKYSKICRIPVNNTILLLSLVKHLLDNKLLQNCDIKFMTSNKIKSNCTIVLPGVLNFSVNNIDILFTQSIDLSINGDLLNNTFYLKILNTLINKQKNKTWILLGNKQWNY